MEEWRTCEDCPLYEVSSLGNVRRRADQRLLKPWDNGLGYLKVTLHSGGGVRKKVYVHRLVGKAFLGLTDGRDIDHRFHDLTDYQRIRIATRAQNNANSPPRAGSSRYKGVSWAKKDRRWYACIGIDGRTIGLGQYKDEVEAAKAYDRAALAAWGEFAYLNFPT